MSSPACFHSDFMRVVPDSAKSLTGRDAADTAMIKAMAAGIRFAVPYPAASFAASDRPSRLWV